MPFPSARRSAAVVLLTLAAGFAASCGSPERGAGSVLFVTIDTLRPDHVGIYGHPDARTPRLDALARSGAMFTDARVPYPLTLPSHSSLLTGRLPYRHGARRNDSFALDPELPTIAGTLGEAGRATAAIVSTFVLNRNFGLSRTFGTYHDLSDPADMKRGKNERRADEVTDLARAWITDRPDSSFFLWTHFFDPHDDYEPPFPYDTIYAGGERDLYDGEIAYTDFEFGRLLRRLERRADRDRLLIVVTSDHGEAFGEHQEVGHGFFLYDTTVRVPLFFSRGDRAGAGRIHGGSVSSLDVFPTLCRLMGVSGPDRLPGVDLDPFGKGPRQSEPLYLETFEPTIAYGATDLRAIVDGRWKWVEAPIPELYDLASDPHELDNLEGAEPDLESEMAEVLAAHLEAEREAGRFASADENVDDETRARLLSLGYLTTDPEEEAAVAWTRRDPKEIMHLMTRMFEGIKHCRNDRWEEGLPLLQSVLDEDPINGKALHWLSRARSRAGDTEGAVAVYRRAIEHDPGNPALLNSVALVHLQARQADEAIVALKSVVSIDPRHVSGWLNLASAHLQRKEPRRARHAVLQALEVDPLNPIAIRMASRMGIRPRAGARDGS